MVVRTSVAVRGLAAKTWLGFGVGFGFGFGFGLGLGLGVGLGVGSLVARLDGGDRVARMEAMVDDGGGGPRQYVVLGPCAEDGEGGGGAYERGGAWLGGEYLVRVRDRVRVRVRVRVGVGGRARVRVRVRVRGWD